MSTQHLTYKHFTSDDRKTTTTLLHESIPITGALLAGTYATSSTTGRELNIKTYSHGMFQSVYDYPYLSSSANHIFDISVGFSAKAESVSSSATSQVAKKVNVYTQMAQVLAGFDTAGSVLRFDDDGNTSDATGKMDETIFFNFSRLLTKDEIKKGSFSMQVGNSTPYGTPHASTVTISDSESSTNFRSNSPAGEYGFLKNAATAAAVTITFSAATTAGKKVTITATDGTAVEFSAHAGTTNGTTFSIAGANLGADNLKTAIEASAISAKVTVGSVVTVGSTRSITVKQKVAGAAGNKAIASDMNNVTIGSAAAQAAGVFSGGLDASTAGLIYYQTGIAVVTASAFGATPQIMNTSTSSNEDVLKKATVDGFADGLRRRISKISFNNTTELNSTSYTCKIGHNDFNYSSNPTYIKNSKIVVKTDPGVSNESKLPPTTYITTVGLYSANNELLAVAKLSEPLKNDPTVSPGLRVRLDF